ncbi:MAG: D-alanine--D-alanine ligase [Chitinophagia bacterium]|nr:D-alanine--D-alanine ligase [Chitinophagia bacterium]
MIRKKIALVTGGYSGESVISYRTATTIRQHLDTSLFDVYWIDITREGWYYVNETGQRVVVCKDDFSIAISGETIRFDAVFIALHGTPGEDGKLQGYFDMLGIPYTGCDATTSALTFNKRYATAVAAAAGVAVAKSVLLIKGQTANWEQRVSSLRFPVFVKPNNGGSSIGMSKVEQPGANLQVALDKAFAEDDQVLIEEMVVGREFTVGVFSTGSGLQVLPITEVRADADMPFFDFVAKYQGKSTETTPAEIEESMADKIRSAAQQVYRAFNCRGVVRIDFIYQVDEQQPYMLELNSIPGQSEASIIPQQVRSMGWTLNEFYKTLLLDCLSAKPQ